MIEQLEKMFVRHREAFRATYGLQTAAAVSVDAAVVLVGTLMWLFATGPVKWVGALVAIGSAVGLAVRGFRAVKA